MTPSTAESEKRNYNEAALSGTRWTTSSRLDDGKVYEIGGTIIIGTAPLSDAEATVRRITHEVFGVPFLKYIKAYQPTSEEILTALGVEP
jgi:hypothetical protein